MHNLLFFSQIGETTLCTEDLALQDWRLMTSYAEDQANPPAAPTLAPPKAAKRANVVATKARCRAHETQNVQGGTPGGQRPQRRRGCPKARRWMPIEDTKATKVWAR